MTEIKRRHPKDGRGQMENLNAFNGHVTIQKYLGRFLAFLLFSLVFTLSCSKDSVIPDLPKNPRDMTWTIDTLAYPGSFQTMMTSIAGTSPVDLYVAGHNYGPYAQMYHYDGATWTPVKLSQLEGGPFLGVGSFNDMIAFSDGTLFAVGHKYTSSAGNYVPFVIRKNGSQWIEIPISDTSSSFAISCWGAQPGEMWFGTSQGKLYHLSGTLNSPDSVAGIIEQWKRAGMQCSISSITGSSNNDMYLLVLARQTDNSDRYYIVARKNGVWGILDSVTNYYISKLWTSPSGTLFRIGEGVLVHEANVWRQSLPMGIATIGIGGTSDNSLIATGFDGNFVGRALHFDGSSWYDIKQLQISNVNYTDVWINEKEVFIVGILDSSGQKTIIAHGK